MAPFLEADYNGQDDYEDYDDYADYDDYDPNDIPADQAKDTTEYKYPVPENPLILPIVTPEELYDDYDPDDVPDDQANPGYGSTAKDLDAGDNYDDYDPDDIPDDQAAPSGYFYPAPENPLRLMNNKIQEDRHLIGQLNSFRQQPKNGRNELGNQNQKRGIFTKLNKTEKKREDFQVRKSKVLLARKVQPRHSLENRTGLTSVVTNRKGRMIISGSDWLARG